jgi:hypothetical protein
MDIAFHYFAIKSLACAAGFNAGDAQIIAQFSQYVDDYNPTYPRRYSDVPQSLKDSGRYDLYISGAFNPFNFQPATTGFNAFVDFKDMATESFQRLTISPFHFIPFNRDKFSRGDLTTYPARATNGGDGSFISNQLLEAKRDFLTSGANADARRQSLMHIGMLLHVFADTYAHQTFSGYNDSCNNMQLTRAIDVGTGADKTADSFAYVEAFVLRMNELVDNKFGSGYKIGHMLVNHIPDLTNIDFEMNIVDKTGLIRPYRRNNVDTFLDASREIVNFLRECLGHTTALSDADWNSLAPKLRNAFVNADIMNKSSTDAVSTLKRVWAGEFPNCVYRYDCAEIFGGIVKGGDAPVKTELQQGANDLFPVMGEDFYKYNQFAEDLLIEIYGNNKPRTS